MKASHVIPVLAFLGMLLAFAIGGCGGGGGGGTSTTSGTSSGGTGTRIRGSVINNDTLAGVANVTVTFFNASGTAVAQAVTNSAGAYEAQITAIPTRLHLQNAGWPIGFYRTYTFRGDWYQPSIASCRADIPTITPDVVNNLTAIELVPSYEPPPPPPTGCPTGP